MFEKISSYANDMTILCTSRQYNELITRIRNELNRIGMHKETWLINTIPTNTYYQGMRRTRGYPLIRVRRQTILYTSQKKNTWSYI